MGEYCHLVVKIGFGFIEERFRLKMTLLRYNVVIYCTEIELSININDWGFGKIKGVQGFL